MPRIAFGAPCVGYQGDHGLPHLGDISHTKEIHMDLGNVQQLVGSTAYGSDGEKIGKVGQVYLDDSTGEPDWATVNTGPFGTSETFVPLQGASVDNDRLNVAHSQEKVKDAPNVDLDGDHLPESEERRLYEHYGIGFGDPR